MASLGSGTHRRWEPHRAAVLALATCFFALCTWSSYVRWAAYGYRTFDLAYYVQAIWQLIHGRFEVSVQYVPLLGNHVEPVVLLFAPVFFLLRHPMLFVAVQNAGLAAMGPVGYDIARRLGLAKTPAALAASTLLLMPATAYVALHEFHPEALAAPLLLLLLRARLVGSLRQHWLWFGAVLACKENMALLLVAYCTVQVVWERKAGLPHLRAWYLGPMAVALGWFVLASKVITPLLNSGNIDYLALYQRLGETPGEILLNSVREPQRIVSAIWEGVTQGNLLQGLMLPLLCLPLLRPKWLLVCAPIVLQHLLSWRSSEWTIYFHYAAPLVPLLWFAAAEACTKLRSRVTPALLLAACVAGQYFLGPAADIVRTAARSLDEHNSGEQTTKDYFVSQIPPEASVVAPLPYLSHLALRRELHSLHYILKGLKTLSRERFAPPGPTDFVLIDYGDTATFDARAGYYHPLMRTAKGEIIPSSDELLHAYLRQASWQSTSRDELTLLRRRPEPMAQPSLSADSLVDLGGGNNLIGVARRPEEFVTGQPDLEMELTTTWSLGEERSVFPWLELHAVNVETGARTVFTRGLCAPEAGGGIVQDRWRSSRITALPPGIYAIEAHFFDQPKRLSGTGSAQGLLGSPLSLGTLRVRSPGGSPD